MLAINLRILLKIINSLQNWSACGRLHMMCIATYILLMVDCCTLQKVLKNVFCLWWATTCFYLWNCFWHTWSKSSKFFSPAAGYIVKSFPLLLAINLRILLKKVKSSTCKLIHLRRAAYSVHYYIFCWKLIAALYKKSEKCLLPAVGHHMFLSFKLFLTCLKQVSIQNSFHLRQAT